MKFEPGPLQLGGVRAMKFEPGPLQRCHVTSCDVAGECSVNNRKGRLFLMYELNLTLGLAADAVDGEDALQGRMRFADVSATEIDELQCECEIEAGGDTALAEAVRTEGVAFVTDKLRFLVLSLQEELRTEHAEQAPPTSGPAPLRAPA